MTPAAAGLAIVGYADRISVAPEETVGICVSCEADVDRYRAEVVRLLHGDLNPAGPGPREAPAGIATTEHRGRRQEISPGSHVLVPHEPALEPAAISIVAMIWPTRPSGGRQGIVAKWSEEARAGYGLIVDDDGCLALLLGDGDGVDVISSGNPLMERCWYLAAATFDPETGTATVLQSPAITSTNCAVSPLLPRRRLAAHVSRRARVAPAPSGAPLVIAGRYNGKIDRPRVAARALPLTELAALADDPEADGVVAAWDFAREITHAGVCPFERITDASPNGFHGVAVNAPARAMTGANWTGREHRFTHAPEEYGAIHFHDDDLEDAGWEPDFRLRVPAGLRSGVYAAKLTSGEHEEYVPFVVRPPRDGATARVALLLPTHSYLAYANDNVAIDDEFQELATGRTAILNRHALHLNRHREYGGSLYDLHSDGSGTCHASWRRPVLTLRPKLRHTYARAWQFNADLHLVDWLHRNRIDVDIFCDEDLHLEGADLLRRYRVVLTGSHPEYCSERMLDAIEEYLAGGGRMMYLGGNGFYWVVAVHPEKPHLIEVRRWGGTGNWSADPGEQHCDFSGEPGGIWRHRGRPPQKLFGVGFVAQGLDVSGSYRRLPDSLDPRASWIFDGVTGDPAVGDFGLAGDGAAGLEVDCYDPELGSPPHAFLLATAVGFTSVFTEARENFGGTVAGLGGDENPRVRNDLVYFTTPKGGAVFSTGSIAWCASLSHNGYDNDIARITENVLRRFAAD